MAVDFSHCKAQWSYGGFHIFRTKLAAEIGIVLDDMKGFNGQTSWEGLTDDIIPLLNHSDCDGGLPPDECRKIAPRLRELVSKWPDEFDKNQALELAEGLELAAKENEHFLFE
jgi:hypothetical protein